MSSGMQILAPTEQDIRQMIAARVHLGDTNADHRMMHYVHSVSTVRLQKLGFYSGLIC